ncbi:MAG: hypothetical protein EPO57_01150 [Chitinophagaceae bacterium]|nr:MAG: hypothetical protein EPO57_01150 [Chitinophagaceae bacterium]
MKQHKSTLLVFALLIIVSALYRVWDGRPMGFAPQIAMALFAGSVIKNKKWAFLFPVLSMLISDALYQILYSQGLTTIKGFYGGQWENYLLIAGLTIIGFFIKGNKFSHIGIGAVAGSVIYFIVSNFLVWISGGLDINNLPYQRSIDGLVICFTVALPFFKWSLLSTFIFSGLFFGSYSLLHHRFFKGIFQSA